MKELKITERGYPGHFIGSFSCVFRRNTLIEYGDKRVVVSTVGNYRPNRQYNKDNLREHQIGVNRYYETMVFEAHKEGVYWEANVSREVDFESKWALDEYEQETDLKADEMHDAVVAEIARKIKKSNFLKS